MVRTLKCQYIVDFLWVMMEILSKQKTIELREKYIGKSCKLFFNDEPLKIVKAKGQYMYDEKGFCYLDCINNVAHVGHCHPDVVEAGSKQMALLSTNNRFLHDNLVICAKKLVDTMINHNQPLVSSPLSVCFFVNSGSEANDLAIRLARIHTGNQDLITLENAYHGHLTSTIDVSPLKHKEHIGYKSPDYIHIAPSPDVYRGKYSEENSLDNAGILYANEIRNICLKLKEKNRGVCAFIAESMQSCGGQIIPPDNYFQQVYDYVRKAGGVCIADEVQVGFGRIGTHWWGFQKYNVYPDIVTIGKAMGNGHPVSAVVTTKAIAQSFQSIGSEYFNTFGGNPVSCAISNAVLNVIVNENLMENANRVGTYLLTNVRNLMSKHKYIGDVRGVGLFIGIELVWNRFTKEPAGLIAKAIVNRMKQKRILLSAEGEYDNVLKIKPPLVFTMENVDTLVMNLDDVLESISKDLSSNRISNGSATVLVHS